MEYNLKILKHLAVYLKLARFKASTLQFFKKSELISLMTTKILSHPCWIQLYLYKNKIK